MAPKFYEVAGELTVERRVSHGRETTLVRSRYRRTTLLPLLVGLAFCALGSWYWDVPVISRIGSVVAWAVGFAILLFGLSGFSRGDWLLVDGEQWFYRCRVLPWRKWDSVIPRADAVGLRIDAEPHEHGSFGLKLRIREGELLLFSSQNIETVREAARRVSQALGLRIEDQLSHVPASGADRS